MHSVNCPPQTDRQNLRRFDIINIPAITSAYCVLQTNLLKPPPHPDLFLRGHPSSLDVLKKISETGYRNVIWTDIVLHVMKENPSPTVSRDHKYALFVQAFSCNGPSQIRTLDSHRARLHRLLLCYTLMFNPVVFAAARQVKHKSKCNFSFLICSCAYEVELAEGTCRLTPRVLQACNWQKCVRYPTILSLSKYRNHIYL